MRVRIVLPFVLRGQVIKAGEEIELEEGLARDLIYRQRALQAPPPAAVQPADQTEPAPARKALTTKSAPALVAGKE